VGVWKQNIGKILTIRLANHHPSNESLKFAIIILIINPPSECIHPKKYIYISKWREKENE